MSRVFEEHDGEVAEDQPAMRSYEYVLGLDIAMHVSLIVQAACRFTSASRAQFFRF